MTTLLQATSVALDPGLVGAGQALTLIGALAWAVRYLVKRIEAKDARDEERRKEDLVRTEALEKREAERQAALIDCVNRNTAALARVEGALGNGYRSEHTPVATAVADASKR
jgi:hypothetical protein